ncbi:hypothetical protein WR25_09529 isoform F [Diploscapter pachys]|uniref:Uncharacterized protein n=1 Tax=Diploscapter pachys TaxID=2018661 RepID=A0A2A2JXC8_9BILA|nr:hypothetical protein WR25_09529 isoform C [Diploscapter pachys]PAV66364.1 hypothetical protein WR25_09529 isoform F [Diploscapter pachys]
MEDLRMVPDLLWIARGVAKSVPNKVKLDPAELQQLIQGSGNLDDESGEEEGEPMEEETPAEEKSAETDSDAKYRKHDIDDDKVEEAYLKDFDAEGEENAMRGVAMYASNKDDPYITQQVDSDEEEEKDDILIKPNDNLVAVAKVVKDEYNLDIYVYNQTNDDWYCHHHYILEAPPLCLETIQHDPGNDETGKGNLIALGTMDTKINIWDLDVMNACMPIVTLGEKPASKEGKSRKKRDGSQQGHSDAVISLSWNRNTPHVLASGGADQQIVLWDLDEAKAAQILPPRGAEVQTIQWHANEDTILLAGMMNGTVQIIDCRDNESPPVAEWKFGGQIEKVIWNHFDLQQAIVTTDEGLLSIIDTRKSNQVLSEARAHEGGVSGVSLSLITKGLLATAGEDQVIFFL